MLKRYIFKKIKRLLLILLLGVVIYNYFFKSSGFDYNKKISNRQCMPLSIELEDYSLLLKHADKNKHPVCKLDDWVIVNTDAKITYNYAYLRSMNINITYCTYQTIRWDRSDFKHIINKPVQILDGGKLDEDEEFFLIRCKSSSKLKVYSGLHARIFKKKPLLHDEVKKRSDQPVNVMFLGLDSVSREKWLSNLPRSSLYFLKNMKGFVLNGYNIVGDGTPAAIIPILTSKHEQELPNVLKGTSNASYVDEVYPFVWRDFERELNYATLYNEDWPHVGVFQYRMIGFKNPPTTHYMRPFQLAKKQSNICEYGRSSIQLNIDYLEDFMQNYKSTGFFSFSHIKQYTHNEGLNDITWLDDPLFNFLNRFNSDQSLSESTILFLFSDHGPRYTKLRKSIKGLLHERNPFFSIYIPRLFQKRYPNEYASLQRNLDTVVAPMDIYATLINLISLESGSRAPKTSEIIYEKDRSTSLFSDLSPDRTCDDAGIDTYWCSCLKRAQLPVNEYLTSLAEEFVSYLNKKLLKGHTDLCKTLELKSVNSVYQIKSYIKSDQKAHEVLVANNKFATKLKLLKPPEIERDFKKYLFMVTTRPNGGDYEFTMTVQRSVADNKELKDIDERLISRTNKYGDDEHCIHVDFPDLRKYCFCRDIADRN